MSVPQRTSLMWTSNRRWYRCRNFCQRRRRSELRSTGNVSSQTQWNHLPHSETSTKCPGKCHRLITTGASDGSIPWNFGAGRIREVGSRRGRFSVKYLCDLLNGKRRVRKILLTPGVEFSYRRSIVGEDTRKLHGLEIVSDNVLSIVCSNLNA